MNRQNVLLLTTAAVVAVSALSIHLDANDSVFVGDLVQSPSGSGLHAVVVMQLKDCDSNLAFLHALQRPSIERLLTVEGLIVTTDGDGTRTLEAATARLSGRGLKIGLREAGIASREMQFARSIGFRETPYMFVVADDQIRYAAPLPANPESFRSFENVIQEIAVAARANE